MIRLLVSFYDFDDNQIFLDGIDLNHIHSSDLRRQLGLCCIIFSLAASMTILPWEIRKVTRERAIEAAKTVNAHDFISQLPLAYDSPPTSAVKIYLRGSASLACA